MAGLPPAERRQPRPFSAFIRLDEGAILSLSPERFIQLRRGDPDAADKGTLPRLDSPLADAQQAEKLANSPKDRAENLMIVDLMRNDIGRVAVPGSVRVPELFVVEPFPAVHHLVSTITARLPMTLHASDLLRAAFPAARSPARRKCGRWRLSMNWSPSVATPGVGALAT